MAPVPETLQLDCTSLHPGLGTLIDPLLETAADSLELAADFFGFSLVVDDFPGLEEAPAPWLQLREARRAGRTVWYGTLFCSESFFVKNPPSAGGILPAAEIWDPHLAPAGGFEEAEFSARAAEVFLHHELLTARDLVRKEVAPGAIPRGRVEAFGMLWAVTVDGRLHRLGLPGYNLAARRSRFSRFFSSRGVLLPNHWEIFESLWDGNIAGWRDVLAILRHLPGPGFGP